MAKKSKDKSTKRAALHKIRRDAGSVRFSTHSIKTGRDFADLMSSLMSDLLGQKISPEISNAVCNAGGKLLKIAELQFKYGRPDSAGQKRITLALDDGRK